MSNVESIEDSVNALAREFREATTYQERIKFEGSFYQLGREVSGHEERIKSLEKSDDSFRQLIINFISAIIGAVISAIILKIFP